MNRPLFLLLFLIAGIKCNRPLSSQENQFWKANCGTKPYHQNQFVDEKRHIAGGQPQSGHLAPWAVKIHFNGGLCSGTLISPRHILSATHCVMKSFATAPLAIRLWNRECNGNDMVLTHENNIQFDILKANNVLLSNKVSKLVLTNLCYQPVSDYDDFMIMELSENIAMNDYAYPACITNDLDFQHNNLIVRVTAYGHDNWDPENTNGQGVADVLRNGQFKIIGPWRNWRAFKIYNEQRTTETRPGDSGGSVIHYNGRYYVVGVVSGTWYNRFETEVMSVATHYNQICHHTGRCI